MSEGTILLERGQPLAALDGLLLAAGQGQGGGLWLEGSPGMGKSALIAAAARQAEALGFLVLSARAVEVMTDFTYGVAWSLLDTAAASPVATRPFDTNDDLLASSPPSADPAMDLVTHLHRLVGRVLHLAGRQPLLIAVDDAQWADVPSLRWLVYLAQRLEHLPVALLVASRPLGDGSERLLRLLASEPILTREVLQPLSPAGVAAMVRARFPNASEGFSDACNRLTHGNPFLLDRLLHIVATSKPTTAPLDEPLLDGLQLGSVLDHVIVRITGLGDRAADVVEAAAVLGDGAHLNEVAAICGLAEDEAGATIDALIGIEVLDAALPVAFVHPLVRAAVYQGIPPARRGSLHRLAAKVLAGRRVPRERIAAHLLQAVETADPWVVAQLRTAAAEAVRRGAPQTAASYLRRALDEPPPGGDRAPLLIELAEAEAAAGESSASRRMEEALEEAREPAIRATTLQRYGWLLCRVGRLPESFDAFDIGYHIEQVDPRVHASLACGRLGVGALIGRLTVTDIDAQLAHMSLTRIEQFDAANRDLLAMLAVADVFTIRSHDRARGRALQALGAGRMLEEQGPSFNFSAAVSVLFWCDDLDDALVELSGALERVGRSGDLALEAYVRFGRAHPRFWRGDVQAAAADASVAVETWRGGWSSNLAMARYWLVSSLIELDDLAGARSALAELDADWSAANQAVWHAANGRIALAAGNVEAAAAATSACEVAAAEVPFLRNPAVYPWRSDAALAAHLAEAGLRARRLADEDLVLARSFGAPRAHGMALRTAALVASGERRIELLEEAVDVFEHSPSELERCRAMVDLGAARRRSGQRVAARAPLLAALDLARRRGLLSLERRALSELRASGARPRHRDVTGPSALTPMERRVVELATDGRSNREIAQLLFVTRKTVEWHLSNAFRKLGVVSRDNLTDALQRS